MPADTTIARTVLNPLLTDRLESYLAAIRTSRRIRRDLIGLSGMSDHMLRDIGVTRDEVRSFYRGT